ncbi:hypothetical protein FKM82_001803 [Ascaphus truei]
MKTPPSTCTRAEKSSPLAALYQRQRLSTFTAACHVWSMSTEEGAPFCCVSQASELGSHNNGRRAHHCRSLFSTGLMAERQSANRNLSACLDEENSNNTQDTQGFLTKLLNRQKTRLDERSSQLSNMTLSQTLHKSLRGSDVHWQNEGNHFDQMTSVLTQLGEADMAAGSIETLLGDLKDSLAKIPGASIAALETQTVPVNSELSELQEKAKQQRDFVEHYENQVQKLQLEAKELKQRFEAVFTDNKQIIENKDLENEKVRSQMETHLNQLEHVPGLLITADQMLQECQESLLVCKRKCVSSSETVTELQIQADVSDYFLGNQCLEMENNRIKKKCEEMSTKLEKMISQNQLFEEKLKNQERDLQQSETQLGDKSRECRTVLRLLENAVEEGRKQISEEKEKVLSSELALQRKLQGLESELKKKKAEQRQLESTFNSFEKNNDLRLEELKHSLEKTEHKNQSIQNYVQFLKTSYSAMFG